MTTIIRILVVAAIISLLWLCYVIAADKWRWRK